KIPARHLRAGRRPGHQVSGLAGHPVYPLTGLLLYFVLSHNRPVVLASRSNHLVTVLTNGVPATILGALDHLTSTGTRANVVIGGVGLTLLLQRPGNRSVRETMGAQDFTVLFRQPGASGKRGQTVTVRAVVNVSARNQNVTTPPFVTGFGLLICFTSGDVLVTTFDDVVGQTLGGVAGRRSARGDDCVDGVDVGVVGQSGGAGAANA